jgi:hypothetical protein
MKTRYLISFLEEEVSKPNPKTETVEYWRGFNDGLSWLAEFIEPDEGYDD